MKTLPKIFRRDETARIVAATSGKSFSAIRLQAIIETMHLAGLRVSEVCNLLPEHIGEDYIQVVKGKGRKDRTIPVDPVLRIFLDRWEDIARPKAASPEHYYCCLNGSRVSRRSINKSLERLGGKLGLRITPHMFRHTCATELLEDGFNIEEVRQVLGHSSISVTQVYLHVRPGALLERMRARRA
jgi:site-specific recombinase XerD